VIPFIDHVKPFAKAGAFPFSTGSERDLRRIFALYQQPNDP
jgi:hypothetical protein